MTQVPWRNVDDARCRPGDSVLSIPEILSIAIRLSIAVAPVSSKEVKNTRRSTRRAERQ